MAAAEPRPSVFLVAGGTGIYGDRGDEILTEESELGSGFLADLGKAWEASAAPAREAGIRTVNFRQGVVLSRKGGALAKMLTPFKLGLGGRVGSGRQWWSWVSLDDVVAAYRRGARRRSRRACQSGFPQSGDERAVHEGARARDWTADSDSRSPALR